MATEKFHYGYLIKCINDMLCRQTNSYMQAHNLTLSQFQVLMFLYHSKDGYAVLKDVESFFHIAQSTSAGIVSRLEKKSLIEGSVDSVDRRIKRLHITETGRQICRKTKLSMEKAEQQMLSGLSDSERTEFTVLLKKVYESLTKIE